MAPKAGVDDNFEWKAVSYKFFHVSYCYKALNLDKNYEDIEEDQAIVFRGIWRAKVLVKVKTFVWRLFLIRLPSKTQLGRRRILMQTK